jgi:hypothetical protein
VPSTSTVGAFLILDDIIFILERRHKQMIFLSVTVGYFLKNFQVTARTTIFVRRMSGYEQRHQSNPSSLRGGTTDIISTL